MCFICYRKRGRTRGISAIIHQMSKLGTPHRTAILRAPPPLRKRGSCALDELPCTLLELPGRHRYHQGQVNFWHQRGGKERQTTQLLLDYCRENPSDLVERTSPWVSSPCKTGNAVPMSTKDNLLGSTCVLHRWGHCDCSAGQLPTRACWPTLFSWEPFNHEQLN